MTIIACLKLLSFLCIKTKGVPLSRLQREKRFHDKTFADDLRQATAKYYEVAQSSRTAYTNLLKGYGSGQRALEYGCGPGSSAFLLAQRGVEVTGIDISDAAIERAREFESQKKLGVHFQLMNAEELAFGDGSFDLVCGSGILHHLHLKRALSELARVLSPGGKGIFLEPLGHNLLIDLYRRATPHLRTKDEHPLLVSDLKMISSYFPNLEVRYFHLLSLGAVLFRNTFAFSSVLSVLDRIDQLMFKASSFMCKNAWAALIVMSAN